MSEQDNIGKTTGFFLFRNLIRKYSEIKEDEGLRIRSKRFGRLSITLSVIGLLLSLSMFLMFVIEAFGVIEWEGFGNFTMLLANIIAGVIVPLLLAIYGFVFAVMQVRLNRKPNGIVGIVISTVTFILVIVSTFYLFI